jgi:ATP-binding cassette subfamily B protein
MILNYYGKKLPLSVVNESIKVDQYGANIYGILEGAKKFGLSGKAFKGEAEDVWEAIESSEAAMPAIIRIVNEFGYEHYVVINGIKDNALIVFDPGCGKKKMDKELFCGCFLGNIILFEKSSKFKKENLRKGSLSRFIKIIMNQKLLILNIGILSLFVTGIGLAGTFMFQFLIDNVIGNIENDNALEMSVEIFAVLITALAVLYIFKFVVEILRGKLLTKMSKNINLPLMLGYYNKVTELPMNFFETRKTGEIISRFNDASKICEAISGVTLTIMIDVVLVIFCGIVLYRKSPELFMVTFCILIIYVAITIYYIKPLEKINRKMMEQNSMLSSYLKESVDGMETVKVSQGERSVNEKVHGLFADYIDINIKGSMKTITKEALIQMVTEIGTLIVLWAGMFAVLLGEMSIGSLVTFYSLMNYFLSPIQNIVGLQGQLQTALVAADRLNDVMDLHSELGGVDELNSINEIGFEEVSFRYGNRNLVLEKFSLTAHKGEQVSLVGESGCGKTTAIKLLEGLYQPEKGTVTINGKSVSDYSLESLRKCIAYVPQTTFLFSDTVRNNILFGINKENIPNDDKITKILDVCGCDFVKELPFGIDSMLEENGVNLSGGERQRLAIARALLRKPELLILDEATSALDTITEYHIQEALKEYCSDMIVVIVAHRLSTVKNSNQIYVMENGMVVEKGTHNSLLKKNDKYAMLWNKQNEYIM